MQPGPVPALSQRKGVDRAPVSAHPLLVQHPVRFWLIELPAKIVDGWFRFYWFLLTVITVVMLATLAVSLLLAACGIRWGW